MPHGHVPRAMTVHVMGELTRHCSPGEYVIISGVYLPIPFQGFQAIKAGLVTEVYLEAMTIDKVKKSFDNMVITETLEKRIETETSSMCMMY